MIQDMLTAAGSVSTGPVIQPARPRTNRSNTGVFQVNIPGVATVVLEGGPTPNGPWVQINSFTSSTGVAVSLFTNMRARVSSYTSGSVDAWLME